MRMVESGLHQKWHKDRLPKIEECFPTTKMKSDQTAEGREALPLKGFTGAFVIFFIGTLISSIVFFIETFIMGRIIKLNNNAKVITM